MRISDEDKQRVRDAWKKSNRKAVDFDLYWADKLNCSKSAIQKIRLDA